MRMSVLWVSYENGKGAAMKKSYETIWEIFNKCPNNQMRDVFIDEVEVADTDAYIRQKFQDKNATWEKSVLPDGTIVYDINASGILQRFSFTEI